MTTIKLLHLYPREMNLYGDHGNILTLKQRARWRGYQVNIINHHVGDPFPTKVDLIFGGGGQDSGQSKIEADLHQNAHAIRQFIEDGVPTLVICGLYQLFGAYFQTTEGQRIHGIKVFPAHTEAGPTRLIGNITLNSPEFGEIIGYENHSGLTRLAPDARAFGTVTRGAGNNGEDLTEGIIYKNCIGTYLHGPILPKNPQIADFLLLKALQRHNPKLRRLASLDDELENSAHQVASSRPR